jgi:hypothetical protein
MSPGSVANLLDALHSSFGQMGQMGSLGPLGSMQRPALIECVITSPVMVSRPKQPGTFLRSPRSFMDGRTSQYPSYPSHPQCGVTVEEVDTDEDVDERKGLRRPDAIEWQPVQKEPICKIETLAPSSARSEPLALPPPLSSSDSRKKKPHKLWATISPTLENEPIAEVYKTFQQVFAR